MAKAYVNYTVSKELADKALQVLEIAKNSGKIRKGTNETTKAIERSVAKLVLIAEDVEPEEIVMHIPALCDEKKIPYVFVPTRKEVGRASGVDVPMAAAAVTEVEKGKNELKNVVDGIATAKK